MKPLMPPQRCACGRELPCFDHHRPAALAVERLHQYLHDEGVWPDDDEAWHLRVCEGAPAAPGALAVELDDCRACGYSLSVHVGPGVDRNGGCPADEIDAMRRYGLL
jgi:hypothetical protein